MHQGKQYHLSVRCEADQFRLGKKIRKSKPKNGNRKRYKEKGEKGKNTLTHYVFLKGN